MNLWRKSLFWLAGFLFKVIFTALFSTCRVKVIGKDIEEKYHRENPSKGLLYASWHQGIFFFVYFFRYLNFVVMSSLSKDGELATQGTRQFGWKPVRGSSSKGGSSALQKMHILFEKGYSGGLVVDAPKGPPYVSKIGIIVLAKRTGLPIIPVMWCAKDFWQLKTWDKSIIPKPFTRIIFVYDIAFVSVPTDATNEICEQKRVELDFRLNKLKFQVDNFFSQKEFIDPREIKFDNSHKLNI